MIYTLTGVTKRRAFIYWHICCTFPDGGIRYAEINTGINFDSNGIRRPVNHMHNLGINMQTERYAVYKQRPTSTSSIPEDIESINRSLKKFSSPGAKNLNTVFRAIYNYKTDNNKKCYARQENENELQIKLKNTIKLMKFYQNLTVFHLTSKFHHSVQHWSDLALFKLYFNSNKF